MSVSREGAQSFWDSIPSFYRQNVTCYIDFWQTYQGIFPEKQYQAVGKETGLTNPIERVNCTLRNREFLYW